MSTAEWKLAAGQALQLILEDDDDDRSLQLLETMTVQQLRDVALGARILLSLAHGRASAASRAEKQPEPSPETVTTANGSEQHEKLRGSVPTKEPYSGPFLRGVF